MSTSLPTFALSFPQRSRYQSGRDRLQDSEQGLCAHQVLHMCGLPASPSTSLSLSPASHPSSLPPFLSPDFVGAEVLVS